MMFIVILIALLIERFFDWSHLRNWSWFTSYQQWLIKRLRGQSPYLVLVLTVFTAALVVGVVALSLNHILYGLIELLFQLVILLYCLGPQNLWADAYACINALVQGDPKVAADKLKASFGITDASPSQALHRHFLNDIFIEANRRVFAIIFWFVVLGPVGAVIYRAVTASESGVTPPDTNPPLTESAKVVQGVLDWIPVRIFTFIFALGGHFVQTVAAWRKRVMLGLNGNELLLTECGTAALGDEDQGKLPEDGTVEKNAVSLLDRTFVIVLVLIAIVTLLC